MFQYIIVLMDLKIFVFIFIDNRLLISKREETRVFEKFFIAVTTPFQYLGTNFMFNI